MTFNKNKKSGHHASAYFNLQGRFVAPLMSCLLAVSVLVSTPVQANDDNSFDKFFREFTVRYFGASIDWRLFKAQGMVESRLTQKAKSRVGARGVMQVMPVTYKEIQRKNPIFKSRSLDSASTNINAGVFYNYYLFGRWDGEVSAEQRIKLMLASYNAGYSRVLKAFNKAGAPENDWAGISYYLPKETQNYVGRVMTRFHAEQAEPVKPATSNIFMTQADAGDSSQDGISWRQATAID